MKMLPAASPAFWKESGKMARNGMSARGQTELPSARALMEGAAPLEPVSIPAPRMKTVVFHLTGTSPYMQARFSEKAINMMRETQTAGQQAKSKKKRVARDFESDYEAAKHISTDGWVGAPAGAFRTAMISVCRLVGFKMTLAKLSIFIEPDGFDKVDGTPLVRIIGEPEMHIGAVRNATGVADLRARPMWRTWSVNLRVRFDEDQFSVPDITNLLARVGLQCGVGECRPDSRDSTGTGFGLFKLDLED